MNDRAAEAGRPATMTQLRALQRLAVEHLRNAARDARRGPIAALPRVQRERLRMAASSTLGDEIDRGADLLELLPLFALLCGLEAADEPARTNGRPKDGPLLAVLTVLIGLPRKAQKRAMAKRNRPDGAGERGQLAGSDHETFRPADARRLRAMVEFMARNDRPVGADAAARRVLRVIMQLGDHELGTRYEATMKRLTRAYQRFGHAADMPRYRLHWSLYQALQRGNIAAASELFAGLQSLPGRRSV